ncbi:MAG TPA: hypothetical protein VFL95_07775 [Gemmatimonadales bacterium]|nr:hypothetical protein [Gemmatimonadales bacterium]
MNRPLWIGAAAGTLGLAAVAWRVVAVRRRQKWARAQRRALEEDEYGARQLIQRTLDAKADLRRLAPVSRNAARRYQRLLALELRSLEELERQMRADAEDEAAGYLEEAQAELAQLRTEVDWCRQLLRQA